MVRRQGIRPVEKLLAPSVAKSLRSLPDTAAAVDAGVRRLAVQYAESIDDAAIMADLAASALAQAGPADDYVRKALDACLAELDHRRVLEKLGPKLLDALGACGATAAERSKGARAARPGPGTGKSKLEALRSDHAG